MKTQCLIALAGSVALCSLAAVPARLAAKSWKQKEFSITFWCPPPATDEHLTRVVAEGFNLTSTPEKGLEVTARHGPRATLMSEWLTPEMLDGPAKRSQLDSLPDRVKHHAALEAYCLVDESGAGAFPGLGRLMACLRERDPAHLACINLLPTYANEQQRGVSANAAERARVGIPTNFAGVVTDDKTVLRYREHLKQYVETVRPDLISNDHYHFLKPDQDGQLVDGKQYFLNLALIRMAAREAGKPFLNIIQANTIKKSWRRPNAQEMRFLVFTTRASGARGSSYCTYWGPPAYHGLYQDGKAAPLLEPVAALNEEISAFGPALMQLDSIPVYHTAPLPYGAEALPAHAPVEIAGPGEFVLGLFGQAGKTTAFMGVNRDYRQPAEAAVQVALAGGGSRELDRRTGRWTAGQRLSPERTVKTQLSPGDGRLFRVAAKAPRLASPKDSKGWACGTRQHNPARQ